MPNSNQNIALLNSPYILNEPFSQHIPPLGLMYLASSLEKAGYSPKLFNIESYEKENGLYIWSYNIEVLLQQLYKFQPDAIAVSCPYSGRWPLTKRLLSIVKKHFKNVPIILGGIHPTTFPEHCIQSSKADFIILGEGEMSSVNLLNEIFSNQNYNKIDGIAYYFDSKITVNPKTHFIENLDSLPIPAYHLLDIEKFKQLCRNDRLSQMKGFYFNILSSRSCPNQCTYCNMFLAHGKKWRFRSPDNVLNEIEHLVKTYNINQFAIIDDNFTLNYKRAETILKGIINRKLKIKFTTPNGLSAKTLDDNLVKLLKNSGALGISIAVESGSDNIRNEIYKKKVKSEEIINAIEACKKYKLPVHTFFMVGAPQETNETISQSIKMMKKLRVPAHINITTPYKGTELYEYYLAEGIVSDESVRDGTTIDIRLPPENLDNYNQILKWRSKLQIYNIFYSLKAILTDKTFLNFNALLRFIKGIIFPVKISDVSIEKILNKYLPLNEQK